MDAHYRPIYNKLRRCSTSFHYYTHTMAYDLAAKALRTQIHQKMRQRFVRAARREPIGCHKEWVLQSDVCLLGRPGLGVNYLASEMAYERYRAL